MRHFKRVGLVTPDTRQAPFAEFNGRWRIWQSYNDDISSGTYLDLYANGQADRVTVLNNEVIDITLVTGPLTPGVVLTK